MQHRFSRQAVRWLSLGMTCLLLACGGESPVGQGGSAAAGSADLRKTALVSEAGRRQSAVAARHLFGLPGSQDFVDLNRDGKSDLLWYDATRGMSSNWQMDGALIIGGGDLLLSLDYRVLGTPDLDGDGASDLLWRNDGTGEVVVWLSTDGLASGRTLPRTGADWRPIAAPDFNGDGRDDLLWFNTATGETAAWLMNGHELLASEFLNKDPRFQVVALPDLDGDLRTDLVWHSPSTGETVAWLMSGITAKTYAGLLTNLDFKVTATPDLDGDGRSDLLWQADTSGETVAWLMDGSQVRAGLTLLVHPSYRVMSTPDLNNDRKSDLLWYDPLSGTTVAWLMDGLRLAGGGGLLSHPHYRVVGTADINGDGNADLQWYNPATSEVRAWLMNGAERILDAALLSNTPFTMLNATAYPGPATPRMVQVSGTVVYERTRPGSGLKDTLPGPGSNGLVLNLNDAAQTALGPTTSTFSFEVPAGSAYRVAVASHPSEHDCGVSPNATGVATDAVSGIVVRCLEAMKNVFGEFDPNFGGGESGASGASGSAGDGAAIVGAKVEVYSVVDGVLQVRPATALTDAFGRFTVRLDGLQAPLLAVVYDPLGNAGPNVTPKWYGLTLENPRPREFISFNLSGLSDALVSGVSNNLGYCGSPTLKTSLVAFLARNDRPLLQMTIIREQVRSALTARIRSWEKVTQTIPEDFDPVTTVLNITQPPNFYDVALDNMIIRRSPDQLIGGEGNNLSFGGQAVCKTQVQPKGGLQGTGADF